MAFRITAVLLFLGLVIPQPVISGGDKGKDPYEVGERYFAAKDYRRAMQSYRKALSQNDIRAHYRMGIIYEQNGKQRDALKHYKRFLELARPSAQWNDAAARARRIEERLAGDSTRSSALFEKGRNLYGEGRYSEAEKVLLDALKEDATNPEIHFYLGEVYMMMGEYGKAEAEYNKARDYY